jgi:hypothetical protein
LHKPASTIETYYEFYILFNFLDKEYCFDDTNGTDHRYELCNALFFRCVMQIDCAMDNGMEIHRRLDDYVREMESQWLHSMRQSPFGLSSEGRYVNSWEMNYRRIGYYAHTFVTRDFGPESCIQVSVPATETGIEPVSLNQQPFGWTGKINEYSAELAIWWAFELLSDGEARQFMKDNKPVVLFRFYESGRYRELVVKFDGDAWMAEKIS